MSSVKVKKINLLPGAVKMQVKLAKFRKINKVSMVVVLCVWIVSSILIWGSYLFAENQLKKAEAEFENVGEKYKSIAIVQDSLLQTRYGLRLVSDILDSRFEYARAYQAISGIFPSEFLLSEVSLKQPGLFVISGNILTNSGMEKLEEIVIDSTNLKFENVKSIEIKSLDRGETGWKFTVEVRIG